MHNRPNEESSEKVQHPSRRSSFGGSCGLKLSASKLAAYVGFNPYSNLPDLVLQLVYQGDEGRELQESDANLLGMELISEEENLRRIAKQGGERTQRVLETALLVQKQRKTLQTTDAVNKVHQTALEEAQRSGKLSDQELGALSEGVRSAVFKGFGISHESSALDWYEEHYCGCPVTERNSETKYWAFDRDNSNPQVPSVVPIDHQRERFELSLSGCSTESSSAIGRRDTASQPDAGTSTPSEVEASCAKRKLPFFLIAGKIDGVRDELVPVAAKRCACSADDKDEDDDSWIMRRVVVECKHRIRGLRKTIPVYEIVQATAYCYMFNAQVADLVQVLRKSKRSPARSHKRPLEPVICDDRKPRAKKADSDIRTYFAINSIKEDASSARGSADVESDTTAALRQEPLETAGTAVLPSGVPSGSAEDNDRVGSKSPTFLTLQTVADAVSSALSCTILRREVAASAGMNCDSSVKLTRISDSPRSGPFMLDPTLWPWQWQWLKAGAILLKLHSMLTLKAEGDFVDVDEIGASKNRSSGIDRKHERGEHQSVQKQSDESELCMGVIRLDLDDPVLQPRALWHRFVLPRLRSFVEAVYEIRHDDGKRYRLLQSVACATADSSQMSHAWSLLHDELPWLLDCDTAYHRQKLGAVTSKRHCDRFCERKARERNRT
jgi:hypothetical protein